MGMNYDPGISYHGDQYAFTGLNAVAGDVADAIKRRAEERSKSDFLSGAAAQLHSAGVLSDADYADALNQKSTDKLSGIITTALQQHTENVQGARQSQELANRTNIAQMGISAEAPLKGAQTARLQAETTLAGKAGQPVLVNGKLAGFSTASGGIDTLPGEFIKNQEPLPPGELSELRDEKQKLVGYKIIQPDGKIAVHTIANDPFANLAAVMGGMAPAITAPSATPTAVPPPTGKVRVKNAQGQIGYIPAAQLPSALASGYTQVP
jgi:hypothetical protein